MGQNKYNYSIFLNIENFLFSIFENLRTFSELCMFKEFNYEAEIFTTSFSGHFVTIVNPPYENFQTKTKFGPT